METDDFLAAFADIPEVKTDSEYRRTEREYERLFGHIPPTEMLPPSVTQERLIEAMRTCIESGKDNIFEVLHVEIHDQFLY